MVFTYEHSQDRINGSTQERCKENLEIQKKLFLHIKSIPLKTILKIVTLLAHRREKKIKKLKNHFHILLSYRSYQWLYTGQK